MHDILRGSQGLDHPAALDDLAQDPAPLIVLSGEEATLVAFAAGWHRGGGCTGRLPGLRLTRLDALRDQHRAERYAARTLAGAQGILVRPAQDQAGLDPVLNRIAALARDTGIALAILPAGGAPDPRSSLPLSTLSRLAALCDSGGAVAAQAALAQLALAAGLYAGPVAGPKLLPPVGTWTPEHGPGCPLAGLEPDTTRPRVALCFDRADLAGADIAPIAALTHALRDRGCAVTALFRADTQADSAWMARQLTALAPAAILSTRPGAPVADSPAPVLVAALLEADKPAATLAPTPDFAGIAAIRSAGARDPHLQFTPRRYDICPDRIAAIANRVIGRIG
ncbi:hypothetical protein [Rhodovulum adriaticum]|uniref:Uncharacterized protein n=1 Tax=Rhodovulum adriaticum TaxID=35804 RepID=A0A4R2NND0_RHOAD|nr:hypothetical protein [Rhodovulum adriaticum]MBK1637074.1 hypothetical protein [Rhodovulum adriaticum]TCP22808.1 hypothetical protein EV656_105108 [Rhodovulum adriaticum]